VRKQIRALVMIVALSASVTDACGPEFPIMLTQCRSHCLSEVVANPVRFELARLLGSADRGVPAVDSETNGNRTEQVEKLDLTAAQQEKVTLMRATETGDKAYALGDGLPEAVRLYTAAAVDFNRVHAKLEWSEAADDETGEVDESGKSTTPESADQQAADAAERQARNTQVLDAAIARFQSVLALPPDEGRLRLTWSSYMLGRSYALRGQDGDIARANDYFRQTIAQAEARAPDPLGLANAALGEIGRLALRAGDLPEAVKLYAQQASAPDARHAVDSLLLVARQGYGHPEDLEKRIADPLLQRLTLVYAVARADTSCATEFICGDGIDEGTQRYLSRLVVALGRLRPEQIELPDRAAAIAYAIGEYAAAERLIASSQSPYADWIRAKLALHAGKINEATAFFAKASRAFPAGVAAVQTWAAVPMAGQLDQDVIQRLKGERAILTLSRGDYLEALNQLYPLGEIYADDVRYIAEQVLTVDELKSYVDHLLPTSAKAAPDVVADTGAESVGTSVDPSPNDLRSILSDLLARRLARDGRFKEAVSYYLDPETRKLAAQYLVAHQKAEHALVDARQAEAWFEVARLEIQSGMELRGTEREPDYSEYGGMYGDFDGYSTVSSDSPNSEARQSRLADMVGPDEARRRQQNVAVPLRRFHYRSVGVDHLMMAADHLPRQSQAFAAVLCQGVAWLHTNNWSANEDLIKRLYGRYVREGAYVPWAANFGNQCPTPAFGAAARMARHQLARRLVHEIRHQYPWTVGVTLLALVCLGGWFWRRRRSRDV
jgi:hypothetical protein